jgi:CubicO group peptidase (beta-lactamase class C family)
LKKIIFRAVLIVLVLIVAYVFYYSWRSFPIISGFGAKDLCSCMFVTGRSEADVKKQELGEFPFTLASYHVNLQDSSVVGTVWGLAKRKAIYRDGLGCTVVNDIQEETLRAQPILLQKNTNTNIDSLPWPEGERIDDSFPNRVDRVALRSAVESAFAEPEATKKMRTRAVVVLYDGRLVGEQYANGFNQHSLFHGWSMGKSFAAALIGILVKEQKLDIHRAAPVPRWKLPDARGKITLQQLLQQTTGLDFNEDYGSYSDVTNMLFNKGDMAAYTEQRPLKYQPGTQFNYSSGNSNILSAIIRRTVGDSEYYSFPFRALFRKIGIRSVQFEPDAAGTYVLSSYVFATARDYARFGLLYYNNGRWKGEQILPEGWVKQTMEAPLSNPYKNYGYQFWLKGLDKHPPHAVTFPGLPEDLYYADGYGYQDIYIIPSKKLVVVRLGLTLDHSFDETKFLKGIINAVRM